LLQKPGRKLNGACRLNSQPFSGPPAALTLRRAHGLELFYGGGAGMLQAWVDGRFVGQHELDTGRAFPETTDTVRLDLGKLAPGPYVVAVIVRNDSHNWDLMVDDAHREARGLIAASLTSKGGRRFAVPIRWRIQGNRGGEDGADRVRGPFNEGGLYGERAGWHLPGARHVLAAHARDAGPAAWARRAAGPRVWRRGRAALGPREPRAHLLDILPRLKSGDSYGAQPGIEPE